MCGRTGCEREPVEYVDVEVCLDAVRAEGRLLLEWAGVELAHAGDHLSWACPRLTHCEVVAGAMRLDGETARRRITWEPGTVLRVQGVPRTALAGEPADACEVVAVSTDDPTDAVRRQGWRLLGLRYGDDVPPPPADAAEGRLCPIPGEWPQGLYEVPADYPGEHLADFLHVDEKAGSIYVASQEPARITEYVLPLTGERRAALQADAQAYGREAAAYAVVGANQGAAAALAGTDFTPHRLYRMLRILAVRDAADAAALTGRSPADWAEAGWNLDPLGSDLAGQPFTATADPARCWTAAEAAHLADAHIGAARAYELRADGDRVRTVQEVIGQDAVAVTEAGRTALELLAAVTEAVPDDLAEALGRARTHTIAPLDEWKDDHRSPFGPQGSGVWVRLARHDFRLGDGSTCSLWEVGDGWWDYGADADAGETTTAYLSAAGARTAWREAREAHRRSAPPAPERDLELPCLGQGVRHCDNCGSTTITPNAFLELGWMQAGLGLACGPRCYDAMSDAPGRHAQRHHRAWTDQ
ncbi:hypothetical protein ABZT16_37085 [Streptomyces flaveolus]|uniref:hypothetical protein n=1 Tax=Streptomyces flaveolus TaxID=67297 RepID=UPI0033B0991B